MTVDAATPSKISGVGSGSGFTYSFSPIVIYTPSDMTVTHVVDATGVETVLSEGVGPTNYSISVSLYPGTGDVIYPADEVTPMPAGEHIVMKPVYPLEQLTNLGTQSGYNPDTQEVQLDKLLKINRQQQELIDRSLIFPIGYDGVIDVETDTPAAGYYLRVNDAGTGLVWVAISTTSASASDDTPSTTSVSAASSGSGVDFAREDHVHLLPAGIPAANLNTVTVAKGGTGAINAANARTNLGALGSGSDGTVLTGLLAQGKHLLYIPASAMTPTVSNGCSGLTLVETTAGRPDMRVLDYDASADEHAQYELLFGSSWNGGTVTFVPVWTVSAAVVTGVAWGLQAVAVDDDETLDVAYGTPVVVTDDALNASEDIMIGAESAAITIAGTPGALQIIPFRIFRDVSDANDDMTQDARLLGIAMYITSDAANDA